MRPPVLIGIVLILLGGFALVQGGSFTSQKNVLEVGDLKVTATEKQPIPPWLAGLAVVGGLVLVATNAKQTR